MRPEPLQPDGRDIARDAIRRRIDQTLVHQAANGDGDKLRTGAGQFYRREALMLFSFTEGFEDRNFHRRELGIAHRRRSLRTRKDRTKEIGRSVYPHSYWKQEVPRRAAGEATGRRANAVGLFNSDRSPRASKVSHRAEVPTSGLRSQSLTTSAHLISNRMLSAEEITDTFACF
jgi:hypothetical protein